MGISPNSFKMSSTPAKMSADPILVFSYDDAMNHYIFVGSYADETEAVKKCEEHAPNTYCPFFVLYGDLHRQREIFGQKVDGYSLRRVIANVKRWRGQGASPMHSVFDTKDEKSYLRFYFQ